MSNAQDSVPGESPKPGAQQPDDRVVLPRRTVYLIAGASSMFGAGMALAVVGMAIDLDWLKGVGVAAILVAGVLHRVVPRSAA